MCSLLVRMVRLSTDQYRVAGACFAAIGLLDFRDAATQVETRHQSDEHDATGNKEIVGHGAGEAGRILQILPYPTRKEHGDDREHSCDGEQQGATTAAHVERLHLIG